MILEIGVDEKRNKYRFLRYALGDCWNPCITQQLRQDQISTREEIFTFLILPNRSRWQSSVRSLVEGRFALCGRFISNNHHPSRTAAFYDRSLLVTIRIPDYQFQFFRCLFSRWLHQKTTLQILKKACTTFPICFCMASQTSEIYKEGLDRWQL
jgi:hypothetical protein